MLQTTIETNHSATDPIMFHRIDNLEKKDPMKIWQEMKQNGFVTPSFTQNLPTQQKRSKKHRINIANRKRKLAIAKIQQVDSFSQIVEPTCVLVKEHDIGVVLSNETMPMLNRRTKRCIIDFSKGNMKVAKVQELNRFTKLAAPTGLLNELNPGIINRMRSSEQVFSVINALVRRDEIDNSNEQCVDAGCKGKKFGGNDGIECSSSASGSDQIEMCSGTAGTLSHMPSRHKGGVSYMGIAMRKIENENERDTAKLSSISSTKSETESSSVLNKKSTNTATVSSLSRQGATVAAEWLQFLHQDVTRRLAALKRSQMRIQDVIQTELPSLLAKDFSHNEENKQLPTAGPILLSMDMHQAKWNSVFQNMDKALREEANHLEHWLNEIIEIQSHNSQGFQFHDWFRRHFLKQPSISDCATRKL